jgi:hypothetical protein
VERRGATANGAAAGEKLKDRLGKLDRSVETSELCRREGTNSTPNYAPFRAALAEIFAEGIPARLGDSIFLEFDNQWRYASMVITAVNPTDALAMSTALIGAFDDLLQHALKRKQRNRGRLTRIGVVAFAVVLPIILLAAIWFAILTV